MSQSLVAKKLDQSLRASSLKDLVRVKDTENVMLVLDCSGSMTLPMRNGKRRIEGLRSVVTSTQSRRPTKMIAFGPFVSSAETALVPVEPAIFNPYADDVAPVSPYAMQAVGFVTDVPEPGGGTPLTEALEFSRAAGAGRLLVVSDGEPDDARSAMDAARMFGGRIDVVFVGDPGSPGSIFLEELAKLTGGQRFEGDMTDPLSLTGTVVALLTGDVLVEDDEDDDDDDADDDDEDEEDI